MRKLKSPSRRHVEAELAALRAQPQVLNGLPSSVVRRC